MAGDAERWREWLARHGPALVLFARQWTASMADAEDAVQDGFVRFWQARGRTRDGVAYLYSCVRSAAVDLSRAGATRRRHTDAARAGAVETVSPFAPEQGALAEAVELSLAKLPPEQREVVVMKIWGGLTFAEIATAVGISPNTAASRYRYAIGRLEAELTEEARRG